MADIVSTRRIPVGANDPVEFQLYDPTTGNALDLTSVYLVEVRVTLASTGVTAVYNSAVTGADDAAVQHVFLLSPLTAGQVRLALGSVKRVTVGEVISYRVRVYTSASLSNLYPTELSLKEIVVTETL